MTWRELWRSTVTNLKALLGLAGPPPSSPAPSPPSPIVKRRPPALTGPILYADANEHGPQTIDLTPSRALPPLAAPLRTRKEPKVPEHIAREVAAFAAASQQREDKFALSAAIADMPWPRQERSSVTEAGLETPVGPDPFVPGEDDSSNGSNHAGNHAAADHKAAEDDEGVALTTLLESLLFVAAEPVAPLQLAKTLDLSLEAIEQGLAELADYYRRSLRGLRVQRFNDKVQLVTASAAAPFIEIFLNLDNTTRLSGPALETLAVIAYRQPVTRAQIEAVRGVDCAGVLRSLVQRGLVAEVGRLEGAGRPILYGVTELFMQHFGLMEMAELPPLEETEADRLWAATVLDEEGLDGSRRDNSTQSHPE